MACSKIGAIWVPIFSGFGPDAAAARIADARCEIVVTANASLRKGAVVPMKTVADRAAAIAGGVRHQIVWMRLPGEPTPMTSGRDVPWPEAGSGRADRGDRARRRAPAVHRLHERHDRSSQGRRARARRVPREDRRRGRLPGRPAPGGAAALVDRPRLDHGAVGGRRRARARRDGRARRGVAAAPGSRSIARTGGPTPHRRARRVADARPRDARLDPRPGRRSRPVGAPPPRLDRRAVGPRLLPLARRRDRRRHEADREPVRRHRGRGVLPVRAPGGADEGRVARRARPRHGRRRRGRQGRLGAHRRGRGARLPTSPGRR